MRVLMRLTVRRMPRTACVGFRRVRARRPGLQLRALRVRIRQQREAPPTSMLRERLWLWPWAAVEPLRQAREQPAEGGVPAQAQGREETLVEQAAQIRSR